MQGLAVGTYGVIGLEQESDAQFQVPKQLWGLGFSCELMQLL